MCKVKHGQNVSMYDFNGLPSIDIMDSNKKRGDSFDMQLILKNGSPEVLVSVINHANIDRNKAFLTQVSIVQKDIPIMIECLQRFVKVEPVDFLV